MPEALVIHASACVCSAAACSRSTPEDQDACGYCLVLDPALPCPKESK